MGKPGRRSHPCAKCNRVARLIPTSVGAVCQSCYDRLPPEQRHGRAGNLQPLDDPCWGLIHELFLEMVDEQPDHTRQVLLDEIGTSFEGFYQACLDELIVISPHIVDNEVWYGIAIRTDEGPRLLAAAHHSRLNMDPDTLAIERKIAEQYGNVTATKGGAARN
jgi:hypothetical protein